MEGGGRGQLCFVFLVVAAASLSRSLCNILDSLRIIGGIREDTHIKSGFLSGRTTKVWVPPLDLLEVHFFA